MILSQCIVTYVCSCSYEFTAKVHNKTREGEYLTLTIPCTNGLCKVCAVNHQILSFCINTFRVPKDLIGVNSIVVLHIQISILYCSCEKVQQARNAWMNLTVGHSWQYNICPLTSCCWAQGLPVLLTVLFHTIVLGWIMEIPFRNSRADSKIPKFTHIPRLAVDV